MTRASDSWGEGAGPGSTWVLTPAAWSAAEVERNGKPPCATVLVADDDIGMLELLAEVLRARGYGVLTARDGTEGIELTEQEDLQIDCVVTDQVMPGASGSALAERARLRWTKVPVLIISGYAIDRVRMRKRLGPTIRFLAKPFTPDKLVASVDTLLARTTNGSS